MTNALREQVRSCKPLEPIAGFEAQDWTLSETSQPSSHLKLPFVWWGLRKRVSRARRAGAAYEPAKGLPPCQG